jgi:deoxyribonuclease-4
MSLRGSCRHPILGCHLSIGRGLSAAAEEARDLGINALQIFTHSPSVWRMKPIGQERASEFSERRAACGVEFLAVHTMYLLNLASGDRELRRRSTDGLIEEIRRAALLGAEAVVTHLGAHTGFGFQAGVRRIVRSIERVRRSGAFEGSPGLRLLLENTAASGTTVGRTFAELGEILDRLGASERFGVCLDSAHAFAAGYDLRTEADVDGALRDLNRTLGLDRLGLIHLNDSKYACGARRDRHEHIGWGEIGREGLGALARRGCVLGVPVILETPKTVDGREDADRMNLAVVRGLLASGEHEKEGA